MVLFDKFVIGEETGRISGKKAVIKIRKLSDKTRKKVFSSEEYLTKDKISGLFARFSKDNKLDKQIEQICVKEKESEKPGLVNESDDRRS